jgi:hypothetical protein
VAIVNSAAAVNMGAQISEIQFSILLDICLEMVLYGNFTVKF